MASVNPSTLKLVLQPLLDDEIDDEIIMYIAEAAQESPDDLEDTILGLLPQIEQYSGATRASIVASILHELNAATFASGSDAQSRSKHRSQVAQIRQEDVAAAAACAASHKGAAAALAASKARTGSAPTPSSEPGWTTGTSSGKPSVSSKSAAALTQAAPARAIDMQTASPQLQAVASMFPDIAPALLLRLLTKCAHNVETAVDTLLGQEDLPAYLRQLQAAEDRAAAKAAAAAQAKVHANAAAKQRVLQRFDEHDVKSKVAAPDIIQVDGRYVQIRAQRGAPAASKKMLKKARQIASRKAAAS